MRSQYVDEFNHDKWASDYDQAVMDLGNPLRIGYSTLLDWVVSRAEINDQSEIMELGSGTGNLTRQISQCKRLLCVDISEEMEKLAVSKTHHLKGREFMKSDILQVFEEDMGQFDSVVSTYTIHHLMEQEKEKLFSRIWKILRKGGVAVFGDLMFENDTAKQKIMRKLTDLGCTDLVEGIENEFFWNAEVAINALRRIGFTTELKRFSELSFGIVAKKI